jgi:hypothetical protein
MDIVVNSLWGQKTTKTTLHFKNWPKIGEAPREQGGASRSLIILFRYMFFTPLTNLGQEA